MEEITTRIGTITGSTVGAVGATADEIHIIAAGVVALIGLLADVIVAKIRNTKGK